MRSWAAHGQGKYLLLAALAGLTLYAAVVQTAESLKAGTSGDRWTHAVSALALLFTAAMLGILIRYRPRDGAGEESFEGLDPAARDSRGFVR